MIYLSGKVRPDMPAMITPRMGQQPPAGQPWAADNGRYASPGDYTDAGFLSWLASLDEHRPRCLFAVAPDTFGDAAATLRDSLPLLPHIRAAGYPAALVAQPWLRPEQVPWGAIDALFVGGPDRWQQSHHLVGLVAEAKARGLWVHMGRVNSKRRVQYAASIGCDSVDGTYLRFDPAMTMGNPAEWAAHAVANPSLWRPVP